MFSISIKYYLYKHQTKQQYIYSIESNISDAMNQQYEYIHLSAVEGNNGKDIKIYNEGWMQRNKIVG